MEGVDEDDRYVMMSGAEGSSRKEVAVATTAVKHKTLKDLKDKDKNKDKGEKKKLKTNNCKQ